MHMPIVLESLAYNGWMDATPNRQATKDPDSGSYPKEKIAITDVDVVKTSHCNILI